MIKFESWGRRTGRVLIGLALTAVLAACGGGGGSDAGSPVLPGNGTGTDTGSGTGGTTTAAYSMTMEVQRSGAATTQISSVETVQAVATVVDRGGSPVSGVVVSFSEGSVGLLAFQPQAATGLTGSDGKASVDLGAKTNTGTGATTVTAAATVGGLSLTASKSIAIAAGTVSTTTPTPATISFVSSSAGGQAIAIKGAGGNGRAEAAILEFKVLDATGAPINGAAVSFAINTGGAAGTTISPSSAVSDSSGRVTTTVLSGATPGSVVVVATATAAPSVKVQSDTLLVSNGVPIAAGFDLSSAKYNLDGNLSGDSTTLTARVRDANGNLVPDGVAVSFVTDFGAVGTSTLGGCTTLNGECPVDFIVTNPRGNGVATVVATIGVGTTTQLQQSLQINMASGPYLAIAAAPGTAPLTRVILTSCKSTFAARLEDAAGRAVAAGTVISTGLTTSDISVSVKSGTPVADQLQSFAPTEFGFEVDATSASLKPVCNPNGGVPGSTAAYVKLNFTTPHGVTTTQQVDIYYPQ